jgi:hypothetical protein
MRKTLEEMKRAATVGELALIEAVELRLSEQIKAMRSDYMGRCHRAVNIMLSPRDLMKTVQEITEQMVEEIESGQYKLPTK